MNAKPSSTPLRRLFAALAVMYVARLCAAWLLALPIRNAVHASNILAFVDGERELFEPGGFYLMEVLVSQRAALAASAGPTFVLLALWVVLALGPEYVLLRALQRPSEHSPAPAATRAALLRLGLIAVALWPLRALALGLTLGLAFSAESWFASVRDVRVREAVFMLVLLAGAGVQVAGSVLRDVASCAVVGRRSGVGAAASLAWAALRERGVGLLARYVAALAVTAAAYLAVAALAGAIDVSRPGLWRGVLVIALQQAAVLSSIALRAWCLHGASGALPPRDAADLPSAAPTPPPQAEAFL